MAPLLAGWWTAIWPNLAASLICFTVHHVLIRRHITREHEKSRKEARR